MTTMPWLQVLILTLIIIIGLVAIPAFRIRREEYRRTGKHPKGHYIGWGIVIGFMIGFLLGNATDTMALALTLGLPIGVAIGFGLEQKHAKDLRPLTEKEEKIQRTTMLASMGILILGIVVFFATTFLANR
jgi:UDP-N-acetylmuramyl pentapeptide phosphotransferase/UDP-N-acetylglucosamine-1-phosphate transferase